MTLEELKTRCEKEGFKYAYGKFEKATEPPHLIAITADTDNFMADNKVYYGPIPIKLYYTYIYKNEEYKTADKAKFLIPGFNPKIKKVFKIYINPKNPNNCVTPLELYYSKIYILFGIILLILPFLF